MNKKILLLLVLFLVNISLLYGEDQTEKLVRKSDSIFRTKIRGTDTVLKTKF